MNCEIKAFYSDPHFGHKNIIKLCDRPFESIDEMEEVFISKYNSFIGKNDTCLWLGDAFFYPIEKAKSTLEKMNGYKIIIRGNHDKSGTWLLRAGFDMVIENFIQLRICNVPVRACHYPYKRKNDPHNRKVQDFYPTKRKGEILIHGHTHNKECLRGNQIHVGLDAWEYCPVSMSTIERYIKHILLY